MKKTYTYILYLLGLIFLLPSCNEMSQHENHGPIVFGDSATIVTETNTKNLQDMVIDLHPDIPAPAPAGTDTTKKAEAKPTDTTHTITTAPAVVAAINGLNVPFKEITVSIPDINTKSYGSQNPTKANAMTYQLLSGSLAGKQLRISNGTAGKVSQHYQTIVVLENDLGILPLETLTNITDWEELHGKNNVYALAGLSGKLEAADFNMNSLHKAISKAARKHHLSRASEHAWINSVRNVRSNKKTIQTVLRNVVWKIDGKDAGGKSFSKQLRIDLPAPAFSKE